MRNHVCYYVVLINCYDKSNAVASFWRWGFTTTLAFLQSEDFNSDEGLVRPRRQRLDKNELIFYLRISQLFRSKHSVYWSQNVLKLNILHQSSIPNNKYTKNLPPSLALSKNTELNLVIWRCCFAEDSKLMYKRFITHVNDHCSDHLTFCWAALSLPLPLWFS